MGRGELGAAATEEGVLVAPDQGRGHRARRCPARPRPRAAGRGTSQPAGQRAVLEDLAAAAGDLLARSCRSPQRAPAAPAGRGGRSRSTSSGTWKSSMYHDFRPWLLVASDFRNAIGCGTDTAVQERTRSGRRAATLQPTMAPQSWPTRSTGRPICSMSAIDVVAERTDAVAPAAERPRPRRVPALVGGVGAHALGVQQRARPRASRSPARGTRAAAPPACRRAARRRGRRRSGPRARTTSAGAPGGRCRSRDVHHLVDLALGHAGQSGDVEDGVLAAHALILPLLRPRRAGSRSSVEMAAAGGRAGRRRWSPRRARPRAAQATSSASGPRRTSS